MDLGQMKYPRPENVTETDWNAITEFLYDLELKGSSPETIRSYKSNLRTITKHLNKSQLSIITQDPETLLQILSYLRQKTWRGKPLGMKTIENYFHALSSFNEYHLFYGKISGNLVPSFTKRYLKQYKKNGNGAKRKLISVEEMALLINSTIPVVEKAIITVFAKTGVRRGELISMDVEDIDWHHGRIKLKPKNKRSNLDVYFDQETALILQRWLRVRDGYVVDGEKALFIGDKGCRIGRNIVYKMVVGNAARVGLHDSVSDRLEDHFSPHCGRHWFTTHLRRAGMPREFIQELRGDSRRDAIDIYDHIDHDELRRAYLEAIPRLGIA